MTQWKELAAEMKGCRNRHVRRRGYTNYVGNSPMRLGWRDCIEVGMTKSSDCTGTENVDGDEATWPSKNVEQSNDHEGKAVLEVISVGSEIYYFIT